MKKISVPKTISIVVLVLSTVLTAGVLYYYNSVEDNVKRTDAPEITQAVGEVTDFESCVAAGNPVMESFPEQCTSNGQTYSNESQQVKDTMIVESGLGRFSVELPRNIGEVIKPTDTDALYIRNTEQPAGEIFVTKVSSYGTDAGHFMAISVGPESDPPQGETSDYVVMKNENNPITGTKYAYEFEEDTTYEIGLTKYAGEIDYQWVFDLGDGNFLRIYYSAAPDSTTKELEQVERIIDSIMIS